MSMEQEIACVCKALSDENRIRILAQLRSGEKCACKLLEALEISQPTLSHHMKILCDCGIVRGRREGKWMHYSICREGAGRAGQMMQSLLSPENVLADCGAGKDEKNEKNSCCG